MFRFFENLVDPLTDYDEGHTPPRRIVPFLLSYAGAFKKLFVLTAIASVIIAIVEIWLISYLGRVIDLIGQTTPDEIWQKHGSEFLVVALFILLVRPILQAIDVLLLQNAILPNYGVVIRWRAHRHVLRQSVGWFENDFAGRIANRIMQTPSAGGEVVFQVFDAITYSIAYVIGAVVLLGDSDPILMVPLILWLIAYIFLVRWTVRRVGPAAKASSDARSNLTGRIVDSYTNIHAVKMFAHHDRELAYAKEGIENVRGTFAREMRIYTTMDIILTALNGALVVGVVGWVIGLWSIGSVSVGLVAASTALVLRLSAMTGWIMWAITSLFQQLGIVSEGMETIAQPLALVDTPDAKSLTVTAGDVRLDGVSHHYGRGKGGLDHVSINIPAGQKVGLVGRSGAGKTTLVKLLLRFYDVERGRILIDGVDISQVTQDSLRSAIGMVQQESSLLHRSVRENILYGRPTATEADMIDAAKRAEAHDFILDLEDSDGRQGYDAVVGERGIKLSGGQRQRIALARTFLKDAPILVLDEATSALDSEVEAQIQQSLYDMMSGKTVIAIAHRLSTIAHMDRIVVLENGRIVEDGPPQELLRKGGLYAMFWERQSGGFIGTEEHA